MLFERLRRDFRASERPKGAFRRRSETLPPGLTTSELRCASGSACAPDVGCAGKREDPINSQRSAMPHFAQQRNGL